MYKDIKDFYKEFYNKEAFLELTTEIGIILSLILYSIGVILTICLLILTLPILPFYIINELSKKYFKNKIDNNDNKCKNTYTDCNICNNCEYKEDCKNGF